MSKGDGRGWRSEHLRGKHDVDRFAREHAVRRKDMGGAMCGWCSRHPAIGSDNEGVAICEPCNTPVPAPPEFGTTRTMRLPSDELDAPEPEATTAPSVTLDEDFDDA